MFTMAPKTKGKTLDKTGHHVWLDGWYPLHVHALPPIGDVLKFRHGLPVLQLSDLLRTAGMEPTL
jgi:hypothetical protein